MKKASRFEVCLLIARSKPLATFNETVVSGPTALLFLRKSDFNISFSVITGTFVDNHKTFSDINKTSSDINKVSGDINKTSSDISEMFSDNNKCFAGNRIVWMGRTNALVLADGLVWEVREKKIVNR